MTHVTVSILGSTGSIGTQTLDVIGENRSRFTVRAIGAHSSVDLLAQQASVCNPEIVAIENADVARDAKQRFRANIDLRIGSGALESIATESDITVNAIVGFAGLSASLATLNAGKRLALANKESLVAGGRLMREARIRGGGELLPIDSEHGALFQSLHAGGPGDIEMACVRKLLLTASGGPFRQKTQEELQSVTIEDALAHPTWKMGPKITVDSSTLFNKGLEVIEAHELFGVGYDDIEVVIHPQSVLHSAVEFIDGSVIGQMSLPDMRLPIGFALSYPERLNVPHGQIDWGGLGSLQFEPVDRAKFACLDLAYQAGRRGGTAPTWLNAANEVAVEAFLANRVTWQQISSIIEVVLTHHDGTEASSVEHVLRADASARAIALDFVAKVVGK